MGGRSFALALSAALALTTGPVTGTTAAGTAFSRFTLRSGGALLPGGTVGGGLLLRSGVAGGTDHRLFHLLHLYGAALPGLVLPPAPLAAAGGLSLLLRPGRFFRLILLFRLFGLLLRGGLSCVGGFYLVTAPAAASAAAAGTGLALLLGLVSQHRGNGNGLLDGRGAAALGTGLLRLLRKGLLGV